MSILTVKEYFKKYDMDKRVLEFNQSSATVELAAKALNTEGKRIAKTMSFILKSNKTILIVLAGDTKIDNHKYKDYFKEKARMIPYDEVEKYVGHKAGGVCPFAIKEDIDVYLDLSLKRFKTVFPACGSPNSAIELNMIELEKYSNFKEWIDVGIITK